MAYLKKLGSNSTASITRMSDRMLNSQKPTIRVNNLNIFSVCEGKSRRKKIKFKSFHFKLKS